MDDLAPPLVPLEAPHDEDNCDPHYDGEWFTIEAAARRLGVTATAIRNRIKRGTLETRPNGNFGKLVWVPLTMSRTVSLTPESPATLTALSDHVQTLKAALAKAEAELELLRHERERADRLEVEAAVIPGLREAIEALKAALLSEQERLAEIWAERERLEVAVAVIPGLQETLRTLEAALESQQAALESQRAARDLLEVEAAVIPGMQAMIAALRTELDSEQIGLIEMRAERDRLLYRSWWRRLVG
jgi:DNA repair exonuclease SbcCD ATPase subunit